jgi:peptidoglycan/LPS O-acetylase OafA/YrhL
MIDPLFRLSHRRITMDPAPCKVVTRDRHMHGIDGLRAIAVIAVLLFHAFPNVLRGGFIGVDMFFVISGYIITRTYFGRLQNQQISLRTFYVKRLRRLAPAYIAVLVVSTVCAYLFLTPLYLSNYGESLFAQPFYVQNFVFWMQGDYFDNPQTKPLLHTWSLAIEEQFYLLYGLLILLARAHRRMVVPVLIVATIASLVVGVMLGLVSPKTSFYWLPTRIWELTAGVFLGMSRLRLSVAMGSVMRMVGLLAIAMGIVLFHHTSFFPSIQAVLVCAGTVAVLAGLVARVEADWLLDQPVLSYIGKTSYSLYLWHWPIISIAATWQMEPLTFGQAWSALALTFVCASLSYRYIEVPFRSGKMMPGTGVLLRTVVVSGLLSIGAALMFKMTDGATFRYPEKLAVLYKSQQERSPYRCPVMARILHPGQEMCARNDVHSAQNILIIGDSHADQLDELIAEIGKKNNIGVFLVTRNCNLHDFGTSRFCSEDVFKSILKESAERNITNVISIAFYRKNVLVEESLKREANKVFLGNRGIDRVFLMKPIPNDAYFDPKDRILEIEKKALAPVPYTAGDYNSDYNKQISVLNQLAVNDNRIKIIDPLPLVCPLKGNCLFDTDGRPNYFDRNHLSPTGVKLLYPMFSGLMKEITTENLPSRRVTLPQ